MEELNMAKVNTLIRKGYLLAGVIMAANIFTVNEVKAMINSETKDENLLEDGNKGDNSMPIGSKKMKGGKIKDGKTVISKTQYVQVFLNFLLSHENLINLIGGAVFSGFNNYFKWWDYNPGGYFKLGCPGWRFKRFLKDILQFEVNFNAVRGAFWTLIKIKEKKEGSWISFFIKDILLRGCISMPLTLHIPKFNLSISISLDSLLWIGVDKILELKATKDLTSNMGGKEEKKNEEELNYNNEQNKGDLSSKKKKKVHIKKKLIVENTDKLKEKEKLVVIEENKKINEEKNKMMKKEEKEKMKNEEVTN